VIVVHRRIGGVAGHHRRRLLPLFPLPQVRDEHPRVKFIGKHVTAERIGKVRGLFERYGVAVVAVWVVAWIAWCRRSGASVAERIEHRLEENLPSPPRRDRSNPS
jgi:hypothetical protein